MFFFVTPKQNRLSASDLIDKAESLCAAWPLRRHRAQNVEWHPSATDIVKHRKQHHQPPAFLCHFFALPYCRPFRHLLPLDDDPSGETQCCVCQPTESAEISSKAEHAFQVASTTSNGSITIIVRWYALAIPSFSFMRALERPSAVTHSIIHFDHWHDAARRLHSEHQRQQLRRWPCTTMPPRAASRLRRPRRFAGSGRLRASTTRGANRKQMHARAEKNRG